VDNVPSVLVNSLEIVSAIEVELQITSETQHNKVLKLVELIDDRDRLEQPLDSELSLSWRSSRVLFIEIFLY